MQILYNSLKRQKMLCKYMGCREIKIKKFLTLFQKTRSELLC